MSPYFLVYFVMFLLFSITKASKNADFNAFDIYSIEFSEDIEPNTIEIQTFITKRTKAPVHSPLTDRLEWVS